MDDLIPVGLHLSKAQARRAARGHPVQISYANLSKKTQSFRVNALNHKKIKQALRAKKGVRLTLSQTEIDGSGILDWLKNAGRWINDNIIQSKPYQDIVKPLVRKVIDTGIDNFVPEPARDTIRKGANFVGEKTNAFGLPHQSKDGSMSLAQQSMITNAQMAIAGMNKKHPREMRQKRVHGKGVYRN
jgi:hypothetical protein